MAVSLDQAKQVRTFRHVEDCAKLLSAAERIVWFARNLRVAGEEIKSNFLFRSTFIVGHLPRLQPSGVLEIKRSPQARCPPSCRFHLFVPHPNRGHVGCQGYASHAILQLQIHYNWQ